MSQDSCVISREQLSLREKNLKSKLFGAPANNPTMPMPKTYAEQMEKKKIQRHAAMTQPSEYLYKPPAQTASLMGLQQDQMKKMTENQEKKMGTFIDEMRQNYITQQNANQVPQSLMYRQTQMMEKQIDVLENNQKQIGDIINNMMNRGATGADSSANLKQNVFNDNRRMMLEMMQPINQQLNEMKLLYENTKTCSTDVGTKIDELKKIIALQQNSISGGASSGPNPFMTGAMNPQQMENFLDPSVIKKGVEDMKEQMREVQKEAHLIESEMESRFRNMVAQNEAQLRNVPMSLTQELASKEMREKALEDDVEKMTTFSKTRALIIERLGGPFDYNQFTEDIRQLKVQRDQANRQFKREQLWAPDFNKDDFGGRKAFYDFSTRPIVDQPIGQAQVNQDVSIQATSPAKVSHEKPEHLKTIKIQPPQFILNQPFENIAPIPSQTQVPQFHPQQVQAMPTSSQPQSYGTQPVMQQQQPQYQRAASPQRDPSPQRKPEVTKQELLQLKKQVMEEVRRELEEEARQKQLKQEREHQALIAQQQRQQQKQETLDGGQIFPQSQMDTQITGGRPKFEQDHDQQSEILKNLATTQAQSQQNMNDFMRQSIQSLKASERQSLNESALAGALAEMFLQGNGDVNNLQKSNQMVTNSIDSQKMRQIGEEVLAEKINKIFDDLKREGQEFESSYQKLDQPKPVVNNLVGPADESIKISESPKKSVTIAPVHQQQALMMQQQQPMVVPVIINQQSQQNEFGGQFQGGNLRHNELRDMIQQAVSTQLQIHQIDQSTRGDLARQSVNNRSFDSQRTTNTMREEEIKLNMEQQLLNKQIPVNVQPQIADNLGLTNNGPAQGYTNPFSQLVSNTPANLFNIKPPLIGELSGYDIGGELDSSSEFINFEESFRKQRQQIDILDDRSEGEVGPMIELEESQGELFPSNIGGKPLIAPKSMINQQTPVNRYPKDERPLGQTMVYDGLEGGSASKYSPGSDNYTEEYQNNSHYDSREEPIPKKKPVQRPMPNKILLSGESFGNQNPLIRSSGGIQEKINRAKKQGTHADRDKIDENFLDEDDDNYEDGFSEPGELNL